MKTANFLVACLLGLVSCNEATSDTLAQSNPNVQSQPASVTNTQTVGSTLTLKNCHYPITLIEGSDFIFPDTLNRFGVKLVQTKNGWSIEDTSEITSGESVVSINNNRDVIVVSGGSVVTDGDIDNINGTTTIKGGHITVINGSNAQSKMLTITVPKNFKLIASLTNDLFVETDVSELRLSVRGSSKVSFKKKVGKVNTMTISGAGNIEMFSAETINNITISGAGDVSIENCGSIEDVTVSGAGTVRIIACLKIGSVSVSGAGTLYLPKSTEIESEFISGIGEINKK